MSKRRTKKGTAETPPLLATENSLPPLPPIRASTEVLGTTSTVAQPNVRVVPLPQLVDSARSTHIAGAIRPPPSRGTVHRRPLVAVLEGAASERCAAQRALLRAKSSTVSCYTTLQNRELWLGADNVPNGAVVDGGQWSTDNEYRSAKLRCKVLALPPLPELGSDDDMDWATSDSDRDTSPTRRNNFLGVYLTEFERIGGVASAPPATTHRTPQQQSTKKKTKKTRDASPRGPPRCATVMTASYRASLSPAASPRAFARAQDDEEDELTLMRRKLEEGRHSHEGYISHCLAALRKQPATFAVFEKLCDEARIKATMVSAGGTNFLKRNVSGVQSHTVHAVSERRQTRAVERQKHAVHIKEAHEAKVAEFVQHAANGDDERRAARRLRSQMAWLPLMFFAARSQWLMNVVNRKRRAEEAVAQSAACVVIQRSYRRCRYGIRAMSVPRAFVIRACFLRRVLNVRVRPKLRHLYVARIAHLLRKIVTTAPLLPTFVSIKLFGRRVLIAQRQCRRRAAQRKAVTIAREVQWATACDARSGELQSVIRRGKSPGAEAIAVTDAFAATEEIRILSALPNSVRDEVLRDYETDYRAKYNAQLATWRARKAALANGNRSALSPHPPRHHVAVPGLVMTTLISQAVRIVKSAVVPRS